MKEDQLTKLLKNALEGTRININLIHDTDTLATLWEAIALGLATNFRDIERTTSGYLNFGSLYGASQEIGPHVYGTAFMLRRQGLIMPDKMVSASFKGPHFLPVGYVPQSSDRIVIVDTAIGTGRTLEDAWSYLRNEFNVQAVGALVLLDRQESYEGIINIERVRETLGIPVVALRTLDQLDL